MTDPQQVQKALETAEAVSENIPASMPTTDDAMGALHKLKDIITQTFTGQQQAWPDQLEFLAREHFLECTVLVVFGLVCIIWGWRIFKPFVAINFMLAGALLGGMVTIWFDKDPYWYIGSIGGAIILGVLSWPLFKAFVTFFCMLLGALIGHAMFTEMVFRFGREDLAQYPWLGAVIGAIVFGVMALAFLKPTIILLTSLQGSMLLCAGTFGLLCKIQQIQPDMIKIFTENPWIAQITVAVITVIGIIIQCRGKKSLAAENEKAKE